MCHFISLQMAVDWNKMTVNQLRAELIKRGLEKSGPKSELVKRLTEDDNKPPEEKAKQTEGMITCCIYY